MMIRIDGSEGEGGGQVLRTALGLSLVTGKPFQIEKIRAKREKPGLLRQHLTAVLAATEIGNAKAEGATLGSRDLSFTPGKVLAGEYHFAVGTAGSGTLVLQTILPALLTADGASHLAIEGGTHNMQAPPFDFLAKTFIPLLNRLGPKVALKLERYGFYPAGGGRLTVEINPCAAISPPAWIAKDAVTHRHAVAIVANLPRSIAQREIDTLGRMLGWESECFEIIETKNSAGPGNVVMVEVGTPSITEVFTGFGRLGATAEHVASEAAGAARSYLSSQAFAGEHLSDQLLLPLALARGGSFAATKISLHAQTNMRVIERFLPVIFRTQKKENYVQVWVETKEE
jgi:RNA 3'-terminal phosphate cyclase (ATP)